MRPRAFLVLFRAPCAANASNLTQTWRVPGDNTPLPLTNHFGVSTVLPGYGILPRKVRTTEEALDRLYSDGAVILTGLTTGIGGLQAYRDAAAELPGRIFGDRLLRHNGPGALVSGAGRAMLIN